MVSWAPSANAEDVEGYAHLTGEAPREVLGRLAEDYRRLKSIGTPNGVYFDHEFFSESGGQPPEDYSDVEKRRWKASYDIWAAVHCIKDLYLEFGWDVEATEQTEFRRDEFLERRAMYWEELVIPLLRIEDEMD